MPEAAARSELDAGRLRHILTDYRSPEISLYADYPGGRNLSLNVRVPGFGNRGYREARMLSVQPNPIVWLGDPDLNRECAGQSREFYR